MAALLCIPAAGRAQTSQAGASVVAGTASNKQAQKNPIIQSHSDGKSGQGARPWPSDAKMTADPGIGRAPQ